METKQGQIIGDCVGCNEYHLLTYWDINIPTINTNLKFVWGYEHRIAPLCINCLSEFLITLKNFIDKSRVILKTTKCEMCFSILEYDDKEIRHYISHLNYTLKHNYYITCNKCGNETHVSKAEEEGI